MKWADGWLPAGMHVDRIRAGVKSLREQADKTGRDWKTIEVCPQFVVHLGKTHEAAIESFQVRRGTRNWPSFCRKVALRALLCDV